jgi:hypothetical protein
MRKQQVDDIAGLPVVMGSPTGLSLQQFLADIVDLAVPAL